MSEKPVDTIWLQKVRQKPREPEPIYVIRSRLGLAFEIKGPFADGADRSIDDEPFVPIRRWYYQTAWRHAP